MNEWANEWRLNSHKIKLQKQEKKQQLVVVTIIFYCLDSVWKEERSSFIYKTAEKREDPNSNARWRQTWGSSKLSLWWWRMEAVVWAEDPEEGNNGKKILVSVRLTEWLLHKTFDSPFMFQQHKPDPAWSSRLLLGNSCMRRSCIEDWIRWTRRTHPPHRSSGSVCLSLPLCFTTLFLM